MSKTPKYTWIELLTIFLLFGAYITVIICPILHIQLLRMRVRCEEKALLSENSANMKRGQHI
ncbi:isoprenylcysteine carboxylmethyltransferase family protein [Virgibacillus byunsanensis]|uniref:Isoprenylcysteine carboxylmethyltransferase family protein n=1 Tax=Virgibacillus byunsanensis TaxID=570945 RepID=A0ABW3LL41_9BACI